MKKSVTISDSAPEVHNLIVWSYAYQDARKGNYWIQCAADRERFKFRINQMKNILKKILNSAHREQIFQSRFKCST